ncbi:MAG: antA/AntB antirepressor family protein [Bacteroidota bacterium]|nr:antA/AntB antirepressor family protein [Bacteroidota bacterium]
MDARELHYFLESNRWFADWIKQKIELYGFVENQDFVTFDKIVKRKNNVRGANVRKEYGLTIDMAKELCMIENNDKGRQARRYFMKWKRLSVASMYPQKIINPITKGYSFQTAS